MVTYYDTNKINNYSQDDLGYAKQEINITRKLSRQEINRAYYYRTLLAKGVPVAEIEKRAVKALKIADRKQRILDYCAKITS